MRGPTADPSGKRREPVFVCDRCGWVMEDRRKTEREAPEKEKG